MNKPQNYDATKVSTGFTPIQLGGHKAIILGVEEMTSSTGKPMIKVGFDFSECDSQPGYFKNLYENNDRVDKKWPYAGTKYILTEDNEGNCSRNFKSFISSVEDSNPGFEIAWGEAFANQFKGKNIGIVYGEEESEYNGNTAMRAVPKWFGNVSKILDAKIPEPKYIKKQSFLDLVDDADLPFV